MTDAIFRELLTEMATLARPRVELDAEGGPRTPTYDEVATGVAVRIAPAATASEDDLLGRTEEVTHVAYLEPIDLRPSDRLVTHPVATTLAEDVEAGAMTLPVASVAGFLDGQSVEIGSGGGVEERVVVTVGSDELSVADGLDAGHGEGAPVRVVRRFEVIAVEDEAGMGHHLRAAVREL